MNESQDTFSSEPKSLGPLGVEVLGTRWSFPSSRRLEIETVDRKLMFWNDSFDVIAELFAGHPDNKDRRALDLSERQRKALQFEVDRLRCNVEMVPSYSQLQAQVKELEFHVKKDQEVKGQLRAEIERLRNQLDIRARESWNNLITQIKAFDGKLVSLALIRMGFGA